ncbi:hypothetical protein [Actinomadura harenae]|uniref:DUF8094 domain-containing protein n=1 Tax=Actinomadura harenae TaxID=2483351 RepID=A0A3M2LQA0_9ACTN|nr:hypothetical protein [Actinomadura harenae]RMI39619.1 hypothetical protein EBO15_29065 [Actinomadura harenae]
MLVLALLAGVPPAAGCGGSNAGATGAPALLRDQAQQAVMAYAAAVGQAGDRLDASLLPKAEADPQLTMDTAAVKLRRIVKARTGTLKLSHVRVAVPRQSAYPRWFAAEGVSGSGKDALRHAMLFTQAKAGAPWLLSADPFPTDTAFSRVALDHDGYAEAVAPSASGLAIAPDRLAAAHAALLNGGPRAAGADRLAPGPKTTEAFTALRHAEAGLRRNGITLESRFSPAPAPVHALRTRDGGALVWYVLKQNEAYSATKKGKLTVTGDLVGLAPPSSVSTRMDTTVLIQYLATVPAHGGAGVTGMYRKAVAASGH